MKQLTKTTYKTFLAHAGRYKLAMFMIAISIIFAAGINMAVPLLYKRFFDVLTNAGGTIPVKELTEIILWVFGANMVMVALWRVAEISNSYFQTRVMADLANTCFENLHQHSTSFFQNHFVGSLVKRVNSFYRAFEGIADALTWEFLPLTVNITVAVIVLFRRQPILGTSILLWSFLLIFINYLFSLYKLKYDILRSKQDTKVTGVLADTITNHSNVSLFGGFTREKKTFAGVTDRLRQLRQFTWNLGQVAHGIQAVLMVSLEFWIFYTAIGLHEQGLVTVGDFVLIQAYILTLFHQIWNIGKVIRDYYERLADAEEMAQILDTPFQIVDVKRAKPLTVKKGRIKFDDVSFRYNKTRSILSKFKLTIKAGERVALVGHSGAGKSTIIKLLLRQHDVTRGRIEIDNQRISHVTIDSLRENMSFVPQDPILFHRTLMENIRYGRPDASDEEVVEAARLAHAHEFISHFPEGYDTYVGERGVKLSGGERQRVAIARAILKNSPILLLDEATSSLDSESERLIQNGLEYLMKGKTVIVVAHRLSTIMKMDRILVMDNGKIIEQGSHKELLKKKDGKYQHLWELQAGGFM